MSDDARYMQPFKTGVMKHLSYANEKPILKLSDVFNKNNCWTCRGKGFFAVSDSPINAYNAWADIAERNKSREISLSDGKYESFKSKLKSRFMRW